MGNLIFGIIKILATSIGVGLLNHRFLTTAPTPPGILNNIARHPLFPVVSGTLLNKPELVIRPLTRTSSSLVHLADKTGKLLWEEEKSNKKPGASITEISNIFWIGLDEFIAFGIRKPKVLGFLILGGTISYLLLEPSLNSYLENRRLKKLQRSLTAKLREDRILKSIEAELTKNAPEDSPKLSELISKLEHSIDTKDLNSDLSYLGNEDHFMQRQAILKVLKSIKK